MRVDIVMPKMGESITEGTILDWRKKIGDTVEKDEIFLEIGTDKVDSEIPSPVKGIMAEILAEPNEVVDVGVVIARIETDADADLDQKADVPEKQVKEKSTVKEEKEIPEDTKKPSAIPKQKIQKRKGKVFFTPVVLKMASDSGIEIDELSRIPGSGKSGRVTKQDIIRYIETRTNLPKEKAQVTSTLFTLEQESVEMDHMRKRIAEHMRASLDTAAHVYVMTEVEMSSIVAAVESRSGEFYEKEGFNLTFTPFIIYALVQSLAVYPEMNSMLEGSTIVKNRNINIGMAVAMEKGLMVPVINHCEELNFLGICRKVRDLAVRTRNKNITPDELQGSTFSITNFGVFNVTMGTPIINQPNLGILGVGAVKKRPVVIEAPHGDALGIKPMMFLSLGFDHRLIDGAGGSKFIESVKVNLETMKTEDLF